MKLIASEEIFNKWPRVKIGVVVVYIPVNRDECQSVEYLRLQEASAKEFLDKEAIDTIPGVTDWIKVYKEFGVDPKRYKSSVEALLSRIKDGKTIPDINPLVNYITLYL